MTIWNVVGGQRIAIEGSQAEVNNVNKRVGIVAWCPHEKVVGFHITMNIATVMYEFKSRYLRFIKFQMITIG